MCGLRELLAERNLAVRHFARLIGFTASTTVENYIRGKNLRPENREKIERGIRVLEIYDTPCPSLNYGKCVSWCDGSTWRRNWGDIHQDYTRYMHDTLEYEKGFRELFENIVIDI